MKKFFEILKKIMRIAAVFILSVIIIIVIVCSIKSAIYRAEGFKFSSELKQYDNFADNAFLLNDDIIEFANQEMDNIVLSIDGRREVH